MFVPQQQQSSVRRARAAVRMQAAKLNVGEGCLGSRRSRGEHAEDDQ